MRENWHELPDFVNFCNQRDIPLWFNTIDYPIDKALVSLPSSKLQEIYDTLTQVTFEKPAAVSNTMFKRNVDIYNNVVFVQIKNWLNEAKIREEAEVNRIAAIQAANLEKPATGLDAEHIKNEAEQEPVLDVDYKALVNKRLRDYYFEANNLSDEEKLANFNEIWQKIESIAERIKAEINEVEFFSLIYQSPIDAVVMYLEVESVEALVEKVYASRTM